MYARLLAAEPHATAERKRELRIEAARQARQSPLFFDLTISLSKSISIFHASLGENARLARQAGDQEGDQYWSALVAEVDDMIWQAVHAGFGYFQREAGYTRTGSHSTRVNGRETGQWHEADLAVAHWLQHTSRDGDMQLHVHSQIAHVARTVTDGKWRAPDSLGYNEHVGAVAAIVSQHLEEALTRRFGVEWAARDDGHGFEIKGISGEMMRAVLLPPRVHHRRPAHARRAVRAAVRPRAVPARTGATRAGVELQDTRGEGGRAGFRAVARGLGGQARADPRRERWRRSRRRCGMPQAAARPRMHTAQKARSSRARAGAGGAEGGRAGPAGKEHVDPRGCDQVPGPGAAPLRDRARPRPPPCSKGLADRALASEFEPVVCLEAPEPAEVPRSLLRADGRSVYQRHGGTRFATRAQLVMEERMLAQARADGAPRLTRAQAARALGADPAQLDDALAGRARGRARPAHANRAARGPGRRGAVGPDRRQARVSD